MKTILTTQGDKFLINDKLVYSELPKTEVHGLLMNARFIQGVFDDKKGVDKYTRFGRTFDAQRNTDELIEHLPTWYEKGLRAITVGMQGGGPCFTIDLSTIECNPFGEDGLTLDQDYLNRLEKLINACDEIGMAVIVSYFYHYQALLLKDDEAVVQAVKGMSNWLRDKKFTNVIIEIANEHDTSVYKPHPILHTEHGVCELIEIAKRESGGMLVGCSPTGGVFDEEIVKASTVIFIHGNGQTRQQYYNLIQKCKRVNPNVPIVCNEDSQAVSNMEVALKTGTSWGYYNNMTKQEPPTDWSITKGEDVFFTTRMAMALGIETEEIPYEEQFYLQGLEDDSVYEDKRWIRLASLFPEEIDYVDFYCDGKLYYTCYDDPFTVHFRSNWQQGEIKGDIINKKWTAEIHLTNGDVITK